jgi:predicted helicase
MENYLKSISQKYKDSQTSEMGYRTDFENLLETIFPKDQKYHIHHDAKSVGGNKPDFIVLKNKVPILYIENKDIGIDLNKIEKGNQIERYFGYDNLILTDQVEFRFYRNGQVYGEPIKIATYDRTNRTIDPIPENFSLLIKTILDFALSHKEPIKRGKHLAQIMGGKAQRIRDNVRDMLVTDTEKYVELLNIKKVVIENLVSSLDDETFADMYAQTLVYGLFAARYNDKTSETFSRAEARDLVPRTNPFLHSFFDHIAGASFPDRLRFIVDELCEVFTHADVEKILHDFYGKEKDNKDPIIHFYEDFLKEYDSKKKMEMGVFYTPRPVVQFIVRAVDEILKKDFGLVKGLADTEKVKVKRKEIYQAKNKNVSEAKKDGTLVEVEKEYYKVQILDIATGTGTFLNEVIAHVYKSFVGQEGRWESYVKESLLPRLHGFELMMASYTIAHLKLGMTLADTGVKGLNQRIGVYLTNTLEEPKDYSNQGTLFGFMDAIAEESKSASRIKSEYPIMCVIGNPPYSGESMNKDYTDNAVYKVEPGGKEKLKERNPKWINDDYVKFIRFAESLIDKNGGGVIGMITAHGYIDNPTFRGMRWHLRKTFDKIYIVDLHGNSNKKETSPDGSKDENVFDIKTGVSIILGVKNGTKKADQLAQVLKVDLYGLRDAKFIELDSGSIETLEWTNLPPKTEIWTLEGMGKDEYKKGFSVAEMFPINGVGITTAHDDFVIAKDGHSLLLRFENFKNTERNAEILHTNFNVNKKTGWNILQGYDNIKNEPDLNKYVLPISYRPFDTKYIFFEDKLVWRTVRRVSNHFAIKNNPGLVFRRQQPDANDLYIFCTNKIIADGYIRSDNKGGESVAPLYLYSEHGEKVPNLDKSIWNKIDEMVGDTTPENILDYIYAVLHSPSYREKYKEFLKIDFPRVPYPENKDKFWKLVGLGIKLRELHLMISPEVDKAITTYPEAGTDEVEKVVYKDLKIYINDTQYFGNVPEIAWNFYIGGYQPAQKYLKDRKNQKLSSDEIEHYQRIIKVLLETDKIMKEIDTI